jgi:predicted sugar kinase
VRVGRGRDDDEVDFGVGDHLGRAGQHAHIRVLDSGAEAGRVGGDIGVALDDGVELVGVLQIEDEGDMEDARRQAVADDTDIDRCHCGCEM